MDVILPVMAMEEKSCVDIQIGANGMGPESLAKRRNHDELKGVFGMRYWDGMCGIYDQTKMWERYDYSGVLE